MISKLQFREQGQSMNYITCNRAKSRYKVSVDICSACKHMKKCSDYMSYIQPSLFPETLNSKRITKSMFRKRRKPIRIKPDSLELPDRPEQLMLNI